MALGKIARDKSRPQTKNRGQPLTLTLLLAVRRRAALRVRSPRGWKQELDLLGGAGGGGTRYQR